MKLTAAQAAAKLGCNVTYIRRMCIAGRIKGAVKFSRDWQIPANFKIEGKRK